MDLKIVKVVTVFADLGISVCVDIFFCHLIFTALIYF